MEIILIVVVVVAVDLINGRERSYNLRCMETLLMVCFLFQKRFGIRFSWKHIENIFLKIPFWKKKETYISNLETFDSFMKV